MRTLPALLLLVPLAVVGCGGAGTNSSTLPASVSTAEPSLRGTYRITRVVSAAGESVDPVEALMQDDTVGARFALIFEGDQVGIELVIVSEDESSHEGSESHRLFVVSGCSARESAIWTEAGFSIPRSVAGVGVADAIFIDRSERDDGSVETESTAESHECSISLDAGSYEIVERGPVGDDGRPATIVLRRTDSDDAPSMELTAAVGLRDLDFADFARDTAASEDDDLDAARAPSE